MPILAAEPHRHRGSVVGNGHCVAFVVEVTTLGPSTTWRAGELVRGSGAPAGTAIATFDQNGRYGSHPDGRSHCAILLAENSDGLLVLDQWRGQEVHERTIRFRAGRGDAANDGDQFRIIETG